MQPEPTACPIRRCKRLQKLLAGAAPKELVIKYATTRDEFEAAFRLVHDLYAMCGFVEPHESGIRARVFEALLSTAVIVAKLGERVIATISVIVDSEFGLPMEEAYAGELAALRDQARVPAEVSGLAVDLEYRNAGIFVRMSKLVLAYALSAGVTDLCVAITPAFASLFSHIMLFEPFGPERSYSSKLNDPVVALRCTLDDAEQRMIDAYGGDGPGTIGHFYASDEHGSVWGSPEAQRLTEEGSMTFEDFEYFFDVRTRLLDDPWLHRRLVALRSHREPVSGFFPRVALKDAETAEDKAAG